MGVNSELEEWYDGKALRVFTNNDEKNYTLFIGRDGKIVANLSIEVYEESTYDEYIEVPERYGDTLVRWGKTLLSMGFTHVNSYLQNIDWRYTREHVEFVYPKIEMMTKEQLERFKKKSKETIRFLKKRKSLYYSPVEYKYGTDFKVIKRVGDKRLVYYIYHRSETCKEDCPEVPKAVALIIEAKRSFKDKNEARRFTLKVVKTLFKPTKEELKKITNNLDLLLGTNKKPHVEIISTGGTFDALYLRTKITEPQNGGRKDFGVIYAPAKVVGTSKQMIFVREVYAEIDLRSKQKSEHRRVMSLIKKYLKVKTASKSQTSFIANVVIPYTNFIEFLSELTGVPKARLKKYVDDGIKAYSRK